MYTVSTKNKKLAAKHSDSYHRGNLLCLSIILVLVKTILHSRIGEQASKVLCIWACNGYFCNISTVGAGNPSVGSRHPIQAIPWVAAQARCLPRMLKVARLQDLIPAVVELHRFIQCKRRSRGTAHEGGGCDQSIGSTVSDAIIRSWLSGRFQLGVPYWATLVDYCK